MNKFLLPILTWFLLAAFGATAQAHESACEEGLLRYPLAKLESHLASTDGLDGFYNIRAFAVGLDWQTLSQWEEKAKGLGVTLTNIQLLGTSKRLRIDFVIAGRKENLLSVVRLLPLTSAYWIAGDLRETVEFEHHRELFLKPISLLQLSSTTVRKFNSVDIEYVGELVSLTREQMDSVPRVGELTLGEVESALMAVGLKPGLRVVGWPPPELPPIPLPNMSPADLKVFLELPIAHSPIKAHTKRQLLKQGLVYFGDIVANPNGYFKGVGERGLVDLVDLFHRYGFRMRMKIEGWPRNLPKKS